MKMATPIAPPPQIRSGDIKIRPIQPHERNDVLDFLRVHYYKEEPLTCGSDPKHQDREDEEFNISNIEHGTCLMAVLQGTGDIVGVVLAGPKGPSEARHLYETAAVLGNTKWGKIVRFLAGVEHNADVFQRYDVNKVLHVHVIGVDWQMRGKNIGGRLMTQLMELGRQLEYELMTADCTSYYSAKLCGRLGWKCVNVAYYKDYLDENKKQIFMPPDPHECCKTFAIRL